MLGGPSDLERSVTVGYQYRDTAYVNDNKLGCLLYFDDRFLSESCNYSEVTS